MPTTEQYLPVEDFRKISAEINQINHQRFLICLAGVSFLGAFGWTLFPRSMRIEGEQITMSLWNATLLQFIFLLMCAKAQVLRMKARCLASYLKATGASIWESDLAKAKDLTGIGRYTSLDSYATTITFIALGAIPFGITIWMATRLQSAEVVWAVLKALTNLLVFVTFVILINHSPITNKRTEDFEKKWGRVLERSDYWPTYARIKQSKTVPLPQNSEVQAPVAKPTTTNDQASTEKV